MRLSAEDLKTLQQVKVLLESDFKYQIPLYQLANRFNIEETRLRKGFARTYNVPIYEFLVSVRIERAKELLICTDDPVKAIAYCVGYDLKSLYKQFKKHTGMTPMEWRRKNSERKYG